MLDEILRKGIDGIEAFSSYHTPKQTKFFYQIAYERHMISTCGSDFYGKMKPSIGIGKYSGSIYDGEMIKLTNRLMKM